MDVAAPEPSPDSPAAVMLRDVQRDLALARGPVARLKELRRGAERLAIPVRHGLIDRARIVDELLDCATNVGLTDDPGETVVVAAITSGLEAVDNFPVTTGEPGKPVEPLTFTSAASWQDRDLQPRRWLVRNRIPMAAPTLLSGDGAAGKTTIGLQLAVATVRGTDWLGAVVDEPGAAMFFTAEETEDEVHHRLLAIADHHRLSLADLADVHVHSVAGQDAVLGTPNSNGIIRVTPLFERLQAAALDIRPRLVLLESAADLFAGNENDRSQVRQFVMLLRRLAMAADAAVMLLAHPSLSGLSSGTGTSGSTGWHNSVRARLYFAAAKSEASDDGNGTRVLQVKKSNYGPAGETVRVRWQEGVFVTDGGGSGAPQSSLAQVAVESAFLDCLDALQASGREVGPHAGKAYAPPIFEQMPQARGLKAKALAAAQERLIATGTIAVVKIGPPSKALDRIRRAS